MCRRVNTLGYRVPGTEPSCCRHTRVYTWVLYAQTQDMDAFLAFCFRVCLQAVDSVTCSCVFVRIIKKNEKYTSAVRYYVGDAYLLGLWRDGGGGGGGDGRRGRRNRTSCRPSCFLRVFMGLLERRWRWRRGAAGQDELWRNFLARVLLFHRGWRLPSLVLVNVCIVCKGAVV